MPSGDLRLQFSLNLGIGKCLGCICRSDNEFSGVGATRDGLIGARLTVYPGNSNCRILGKLVDVSAIEKRTDELLRDKPTEEDIKYMAEKYKTSPAEIRKKLKAQGVL